MRAFRPIIALTAILLVSGAANAAALKVGDPAPAISVGKWVKGDPVEKFEAGNVYVMEFWATWCGPCVEAIPHISELQAKYKDQGVVVIGTSVWERDAAQAKVEPFVTQMGEKMNYRVAMDDRSASGSRGKMAETWLQAAGQNGIPCSFIVDKQGKVAWIGHPMRMEPVLQKVLAGQHDAKAAGNVEDVVNKFMETFPTNPAAAAKEADASFDAVKNDPAALNQIAWFLVDRESVPADELKVAEKFAAAGVKASNEQNADVLDTLARVHFEKGEIDKAIEWQEKALAKATDESRSEIQASLDRYKAAKK